MEKLIIFDLDGTLIDSDRHIHNAFMHFLHTEVAPFYKRGLTYQQFLIKNEPLYARHGSSITGWQKRLKFNNKWTKDNFLKCAPILAQEVIDNTKPDDVILTELDAMRSAGIEVAVFTQSHDIYAEAIMAHAQLFSVIKRENVFGQGRIPGLKSHPSGDVYKQVLDELHAWQCSRRIMVENTLANLGPARKHNIRTALTNVPRPAESGIVDFYHPTIHEALPALRLAA